MPRMITNKLIEMAESGSLTWESIARAALCYMSEDEVADMAHVNELIVEEEEEEYDCTNGGTEDWCDDCNPYLR